MLMYAAPDAPSWTDKLEAWSTLGGAIFTASAVIVAFLVWRHDQRLRREDELGRESSAARRVLTKVDLIGDREQGLLGVSYVVRNNSQEAISDIGAVLDFAEPAPHIDIRDIPELQPGARHSDKSLFEAPQFWPKSRMSFQTGERIAPAEITLWFTDSNGFRWKRIGRSEPERQGRIRVKNRVTPLLLEYLRLTPAARQVRFFYYQWRRRFFNLLTDKLDERHRDPPAPFRAYLGRFAADVWKHLSQVLITMWGPWPWR
ncbi:hypothetical protein [Actinoplanes sp. GCM10030250]|uniref:hypothetical protein n=1 Tax=Actinoplanes sp. GCM10030250 TaxID=3273376 RepID=UPI00360EB154